MSITPRSWQSEAVLAVARLAERHAARMPAARCIVHAWMGAGKTEMAFLLGQALGGRVLFLVNSDVLAEQTTRRARKVFKSVGLVKAREHQPASAFVCASLQTLADADRLQSLVDAQANAGAFDLVVADECHGYFKGSIGARVLEAFPSVPAMGATATPWRMDGADLADVFVDGVAYSYGRDRAEADGHCVFVTDGDGAVNEPRRITVPGLDVKAAIAAEKAGDKEAEDRAYGELVLPLVAKEAARAVEQGHRSIISFTHNVATTHKVAEFATQLGVKAAAIEGKMSAKKRRGILDAHRAGEIQLLANCLVCATGFDAPYVTVGLWCRATSSFALFWQSVGRIIRADPDNPAKARTGALLVDFVGAYDAHRDTTVSSVFTGIAPPEAAPEADALPADAAPDPEKNPAAARWRALIATIAGTRSLAAATRSNVLWLPVGKGDDNRVFCLPGADGATYGLEQADGDRWYVVREPRRQKGAPPAPAVRLCRPTTREEAQAVAERAARAGESFDARDAAWRSSPASQEQLDALARSRVAVHGALTKGEASDLLCISSYRAKRWTRRERGVVSGGCLAFEEGPS